MAEKKGKWEKHHFSFKKGQVVHLDELYTLARLCSPEEVGVEDEMDDNKRITENFEIKIAIKKAG